MQLFRCPACNHWRCLKCEGDSASRLRCCGCGHAALAVKWHKGRARGRPHDLAKPPRLGTGRPPDASKRTAENLLQFCERHSIPLNAFCRKIRLSAWEIRQARVGVRSLSVIREKLITVTIDRMKSGRLWLRRVNPQRRDIEWIDPPYKATCPTTALYCVGGLLPGSCPRRWKECTLSDNNWEAVERIHQPYAEQKA
jgi:hypothetical protein